MTSRRAFLAGLLAAPLVPVAAIAVRFDDEPPPGPWRMGDRITIRGEPILIDRVIYDTTPVRDFTPYKITWSIPYDRTEWSS